MVYLPFSALADRDICKNFVSRIDPGTVIYAVGSNSIDLGESKARETQYQHTIGASQFQTACDAIKAKFIYLSSDTIFSGHGGNYAENDITLPGTNLGKAKLASENHVRGRSLNYLIIRSAPLLGRGTLDHPSWIDHFREKSLLDKKMVFSKQLVRNPVHVSRLSEVILKCLDQDIKNQTLHLGGLTRISEYALAERILIALKCKTDHLTSPETHGHSEAIDFSLNTSETLKLLKIGAFHLENCIVRLTRDH